MAIVGCCGYCGIKHSSLDPCLDRRSYQGGWLYLERPPTFTTGVTADRAISQVLDACGWPSSENTEKAKWSPEPMYPDYRGGVNLVAEPTAQELRDRADKLEAEQRAHKALLAKRARQYKNAAAAAARKAQAEAEDGARRVAQIVNAFVDELDYVGGDNVVGPLTQAFLEGLMATAAAAPRYDAVSDSYLKAAR